MIKAAIYGATGYGGAELLRLLLVHPEVDVRQATSREPGRRVDEVHPHLRGLTDLKLSESSPKSLDSELDVVFMALPHGDSTHVIKEVIAQCPEARIFDLAQDFRTGHEKSGWVYGAPELFRDQIKNARKIACPGCFATGILMGTAPAIQSDVALARIIIDAKTGSSGSGAVAKPGTHHPVRVGTIKAYKVFTHQHEREVKASWARLDPENAIPPLSFVPQSVASVRGIYSSCYLLHADPAQEVNMRECYERFYSEAAFVHVLDAPPNVIDVRGTNNVHLYIQEDDGLTLVLTAIDNLCRGASGQAVQCMNLAFGFAEDLGLRLPALVP